jgi:hypothetical protein
MAQIIKLPPLYTISRIGTQPLTRSGNDFRANLSETGRVIFISIPSSVPIASQRASAVVQSVSTRGKTFRMVRWKIFNQGRA